MTPRGWAVIKPKIHFKTMAGHKNKDLSLGCSEGIGKGEIREFQIKLIKVALILEIGICHEMADFCTLHKMCTPPSPPCPLQKGPRRIASCSYGPHSSSTPYKMFIPSPQQKKVQKTAFFLFKRVFQKGNLSII